jgi:alpha-mannosidase
MELSKSGRSEALSSAHAKTPKKGPEYQELQMKKFLAVVLCFGSCAFSPSLAASAQSTTLWELGKFDQAIREFNAVPASHVVYQVGKSDWAQDWPGVQTSGSLYEIHFNLSAAPRGVYQLKVSTLTSYPRTPALQIEINGHKEFHYLHPKPIYLADQRFRAADLLTVAFPAEYLKAGENDLTIAVVDSQDPGSETSAALQTVAYDFISFSGDPHAAYAKSAVTADVVPTIYYLLRAGRLVEEVDAFLHFNRAVPAGHATLLLNGDRYTAEISAAGDAGEERFRFDVPEWQGTTAAELEISAGAHRNFKLSLTAERKWTIFVVSHTHVDIGYTDYQGKVAEIQANTLVEAADLIEKYPDFRFATDGSWNLEQLLETRSQAQRNRVLGLIRADKIGVPADYFNLLTGYASLETLYRSLYYSKSLSREFGLPFDYATTTDVPAYTGAYPSVLASAGIKYWAVGGNQDRATVLAHEQWNEKSPFWWEGPEGEKVLFWYSRGYAQIGSVFGANPQNDAIYQSLPIFLAPYDKPGYKPDAALIYGAQDENTDLHPYLATFATTWNQAFAYPKLQYATFTDFFSYVDKNFGAKLPTYKGDMGPYWEDGIGSDAYYAAEDRQNQSDALSSEIVSTVSHIANPNAHPPKEELNDAWSKILLFAEHTWGAGGSIGQPDRDESVKQLAVKDNFATQARFDLEDIANRSMAQLAHEIHVPARTLVVFNGLNWKRDALMETDLNKNVELYDLTAHERVPVEVLSERENFVHVRFLARGLPPVGYKCFQIRAVTSSSAAPPATETNPVVENKYYRIAVDPETGAVKSIVDKQLDHELVDLHSPYKFGEYLYVTGGDPKGNGLTRMIHPYQALPVAELTIHPAIDGMYLGAEKTPWGHSIKLHSSDVNTPAIDLEIRLYDDQKRIDFDYSVQKSYTTAKEGVYFAFPTAVQSPQFAYATQQGWVDPAHDLLKGASLEWFNIQKWMAVHDSGMAVGIVPLDASLASFGDINRGLWPSEFTPKTSTLFSYAMNNYWHTNYRAGQGGAFTFRYVLTSAKDFDPPALSRLGWESMEAPVLDSVINQDKAGDPDEPLPAEGTSFLEINSPNIVLVTWKLAEDGKGTILRLQETAGQSADVTVTLPYSKIQSAALCNSVEDHLHDLTVTNNQIHLAFRPHEVLTVGLTP